jgi:hypothetical protein
VLTAGIVQAVAITLVTRNLLLLYAAIDAAVVLSLVLIRAPEDGEEGVTPQAKDPQRPVADVS